MIVVHLSFKRIPGEGISTYILFVEIITTIFVPFMGDDTKSFIYNVVWIASYYEGEIYNQKVFTFTQERAMILSSEARLKKR